MRYARLAKEGGADLVLFPEMCLCGYPPEDLILKPHFIHRCEEEIHWLAANLPPGLAVIVGAPHAEDERTFNAAHVLQDGRIAACYRKNLLPNYGVFDEKRVFASGDRLLALDTPFGRIGVHICEDSWFTDARPTLDLRALGIDALVNISASPYHRRKVRLRERILSRAAPFLGAPVLYCNLVGGQDELVFDGSSMVMDAGGSVMVRARSFDEDLLFCDLPVHGRRQSPATGHPGIDIVPLNLSPASSGTPSAAPARLEPVLEEHAEIYAALKTGLRDYMDKNGFLKAVVALSGGIDSALVAAIAVDALGASRVAGVTMPSQFSSPETRGDAHLLAKNLGIEFHEIPIKGIFDTCLSELAPHWPGRTSDITEENLQARIRGMLVMALSNKFGWMVLSTGNKSELATGYCTLYGDMVGGFALIKDVPKTLVFELSRWRNAQSPAAPVIPPSTIDRPPTAELRPNQRDTDSLPPYDLLDAILERYVEQDQGFDRIVADGFEPATVQRVLRLVDTAEYKRRQGAPGVKITPKAFGRDRRMPITNLYREKSETENAR